MPIILLFLLTSAFAGEITVMNRLKQFDLSYSEKKIEFKASDLKMYFEAKPCNEKLLKTFKREIDQSLSGDSLKVGAKEDQLHFVMNGKTYSEEFSHPRAQVLTNIPSELRRMRGVEGKKCAAKP